MSPNLTLNGDRVTYNGKPVGTYALDEDTGKIVFVRWSVLFRIRDSYAFSADLLEEIDASTIYVIDNDTKKVYRFRWDDYYDGPLEEFNGELQFCLPRSEATGEWESLDEVLSGRQ